METKLAYRIETERLRAREFSLEDSPFIIQLLNSPGWLKFIGDRNVKTEKQAQAYLENGPMKSYLEHGYGLYLIEEKETGAPLGMCGILKRENLTDPDIGFAFLPEFHGKGYALEIATATLSYAHEQLGIRCISAIALPSNQRSIRLLEKIGLTYVETFTFPGSTDELCLFRHCR